MFMIFKKKIHNLKYSKKREIRIENTPEKDLKEKIKTSLLERILWDGFFVWKVNLELKRLSFINLCRVRTNRNSLPL